MGAVSHHMQMSLSLNKTIRTDVKRKKKQKTEVLQVQHRGHTHHVVTGLHILPDTMAYKRRLRRAVDERDKLVLVVFWKVLVFYLR